MGRLVSRLDVLHGCRLSPTFTFDIPRHCTCYNATLVFMRFLSMAPWRLSRASLVLSGLLFTGTWFVSCASHPRIPVNGQLAGKPVSTTVDSAAAKDYLQSLQPSNQSAGIEQRYRSYRLDWQKLRMISHHVSPDFAALFLVKRLLSNRTNATFQAEYLAESKRIKSELQRNQWSEIAQPALKQYEVLFVPGFHYVTDPSSGADFAHQRQFFEELGIKVRLIRTEEDGTVEANAAIIAANLRSRRQGNDKILLVSSSKGGPEVALALGKLLSPDETTRVKAWISVGGLFRGTPLADFATRWPQSWIVRLMFLYSRTGFQSLPGLTTKVSQARLDKIKIPARVMLIEYIAVPLSGDIYGSVTRRYLRLRKDGPNDGLTLLADELLPNGISVIEPGVDHFYDDPDIEAKSLALANVAAEALANH
jgi:hypothetical protein